jgi:hypothetical protein
VAAGVVALTPAATVAAPAAPVPIPLRKPRRSIDLSGFAFDMASVLA